MSANRESPSSQRPHSSRDVKRPTSPGAILLALAVLAGWATSPPASARVSSFWSPGPDQLRERVSRLPGLPTEARRTLFFVPREWTPEGEWPLLVALHGVTASPDEWADFPRFLELADRHGFVVAIPDSIGFAGSSRHPLSEVLGEYEQAVIDYAVEEFGASGDRWVLGFSAGGAGAWRLALRDPDAWTGVIALAPAGVPSEADLDRLRGLRVMVVQGAADTAVYVPEVRRLMRRLGERNEIRSCAVELEHAGHRLDAWPVMAIVYGFVVDDRCEWR